MSETTKILGRIADGELEALHYGTYKRCGRSRLCRPRLLDNRSNGRRMATQSCCGDNGVVSVSGMCQP